MTVLSALIAQCRREARDTPKSVRVQRAGDGSINLFNTGKYPIVEGSYSIYLNTSARTETTHYVIDLDNGDISMNTTPSAGQTVKAQFKTAHWRDKNWVEAINNAIADLNARGYYRPVVRSLTAFRLSAGITTYSGPSGCVDVSELLVSDNYTSAGNFRKPNVNWRYDSDANKLVLGNKPTLANYAQTSYLRRLQTYTATSATVDVLSDWETIVKKRAQAQFFRSLAAKIAQEGNASIDEGHFSFTNLRTLATDYDKEFEQVALRMKPPRPPKDLQFFDPNGGPA